MDYDELAELLFVRLKGRIEDHAGLDIFARERSKFEGWLKVETCEILSEYFKDVLPEDNRVDITFEDWAIELKTLNTSIMYPGVKSKTRPITMNNEGVVKDIEKLKNKGDINKGVLFIVFPIEHENRKWKIQLDRISEHLKQLRHSEFKFKSGVPGMIYFGLV